MEGIISEFDDFTNREHTLCKSSKSITEPNVYNPGWLCKGGGLTSDNDRLVEQNQYEISQNYDQDAFESVLILKNEIVTNQQRQQTTNITKNVPKHTTQ